MGGAVSDTGDFGRRLHALRVDAGIRQEELAHAAGVSVRALSNLERGRSRGPQRRTVQALAAALGLDAPTAMALERSASLGRPRTSGGPATEPSEPSDGPALRHTLTLPRDLHDFTARGPALARLLALVEHADPAHPPIAVICGQPGLGKTSFAVHAAHVLAPHFPDGQLHLDLRGMAAQPTPPQEALAKLLAALGVAEQMVPRDLEDRAGLFRSLAATRRLLLVLDNAVDENQLRPLLPGTGACLTIVTSRSSLTALEAVHRVELSLLRREEAVELLTRIVGVERVSREAQATRDLADLCGRLPLALRIAGQRLAARPHESLGKLAAQLDREERRLDTLQAGDLRVRAAFALSYQQLDAPSRLLLRRCALAAGQDVSPETAALLAGIPLRDAGLRLEELCDRGLLQVDATAERYRLHDLLKLFAAEQSTAEDDPPTRDEALDRTTRWMLARATTAALHFDAERHSTPAGDPDPATAPTGRDQARAWLEAERDQWLAALHHAHTVGRYRQVLDTAEAMHWFSDLTQHWQQWTAVFQHGTDAARALGSPHEEATQLNYLAWAQNRCAHNPYAALEAADAALAVARACGDSLQTGWALGYGAGALRRLGRTDEAIARLHAAAACHRDNPSTSGRLAELTTLNALGETLREHGRADQALEHHLYGLEICDQGISGQAPHLLALFHAVTLQHLGNDYAALDRWQEAEAPLRRAWDTFEEMDMPGWSGPAQLELGRVLRQLDRLGEARTALASALHTLTEHHHPLQSEAAAELHALDRAHG
ncbi:ATP-binding protein [Streptomyces sp. NPDC059256]|uniref:ATP-binding protein n=1 Tax=Streptomyces sp. NPDC059256 TaxID=3346794 RepID=UPI0036C36E36